MVMISQKHITILQFASIVGKSVGSRETEQHVILIKLVDDVITVNVMSCDLLRIFLHYFLPSRKIATWLPMEKATCCLSSRMGTKRK